MMSPSIDQNALLALLCNQTIANIALLRSQSVIPHSAALDSVQTDLQNALNEINARSSFANLNVSDDNHQHRQTPVSGGTSSTTLYPSAGPSAISSTAAFVPVYGQPPAPPSLPSRSSHERQLNRAVALWDYSGNKDDLSFAVNDVIIIDEEGE